MKVQKVNSPEGIKVGFAVPMNDRQVFSEVSNDFNLLDPSIAFVESSYYKKPSLHAAFIPKLMSSRAAVFLATEDWLFNATSNLVSGSCIELNNSAFP